MRNKLPKNPYPGLRPFEFAENHLFFGREGQSEEVLRRLQESRFLAVVGTSGSGKSSLVRAGLLPLLYGGFMTEAGTSWRVALFRPGDNPIHNLADALVHPTQFTSSKTAQTENSVEEENLKLAVTETVLRRSAVGLRDFANSNEFAEEENLLIVVDQFEELFRFKKESQSKIVTEKSEKQEQAENEASAFVKLLLEATKDTTKRIYVIITMRSDFLGDCSQFRDLPETINNGQYLIPRLTTEQLKKAIESPAKVKGAKIQPALAARLLNDIGDDQDQLPVLQHALMRTWDKWAEAGNRDAEISFENYNATGGMATALSHHADEAFFELSDKRFSIEPTRKLEIAEKLFKCLTETDRENRETRRATTIGKICAIADASKEEVIEVIETFRQPGRTFLMPPRPSNLKEKELDKTLNENTLIDISHESLIRKWNRLKTWVEEESQAAQTYRRLAEDAFLNKKNKVGFWSEPELTDALEWREKFKPNETWAELYLQTWGNRYLSTYPEAIAYLEASKANREQEIAEDQAQRNKDIEQERKLRKQAELLRVASERETKDAQTLAEEKARLAEIEVEKAQVLEKTAKKLKRYLYAMAAMSLLLLLVAGFAVYFANQSRSNALESKIYAKSAEDNATEARKNADTAKENEQKAIRSETNTNAALEQVKKVNDELSNKTNELANSLVKEKEATKKAEEQTQNAQEQKQSAEQQKALALEQTQKAKLSQEETKIALKEQERLKTEADKARDEAIVLRDEAITAKDKADSAVKTAQETNLRESLNRDALTFLEQGENEKALKKFSSLLEKYDEKDLRIPIIKKGKWWTQHNLGIVHSRLEKFEKAKESYNDALKTLGEKPIDEFPTSASIPPNEHFFQKISYQTDNETLISIATTLRRLGQLYRAEARNKTNDEESQKLNSLAVKNYDRLFEILRLESPNTKNENYPIEAYIEKADALSDLRDEENYQSPQELYEKAQKFFESKGDYFKQVEILKKRYKDAMKYGDSVSGIKWLEKAINIQEDELKLPPDSLEISDNYKEIVYADKSFGSTTSEIMDEKAYIEISEYIKSLNFRLNTEGFFNENEVSILAKAYLKIGKCRRAEALYLYALEKTNKANRIGQEVSKYRVSQSILNKLGFFYWKTQQDNSQAKKYFDLFITDIENKEEEHFISVTTIENAADFYIQQKDYNTARKLLNRAFEIRENGQIADVRNISNLTLLTKLISANANIIVKLAQIDEAENKLQDAETKYLEAINLVTAELGELNVDDAKAVIAQHYVFQGEFYESQNRSEAVQSYLKAHQIIVKDSNLLRNYGLLSRIEIKLGTFSKTKEKAFGHFVNAFRNMVIYETSIKGGAEAINTIKLNPYYRYTKDGLLTVEFYTDLARVYEILAKMESDENQKEKFRSSATQAREKAEKAKIQEQSLLCQ